MKTKSPFPKNKLKYFITLSLLTAILSGAYFVANTKDAKAVETQPTTTQNTLTQNTVQANKTYSVAELQKLISAQLKPEANKALHLTTSITYFQAPELISREEAWYTNNPALGVKTKSFDQKNQLINIEQYQVYGLSLVQSEHYDSATNTLTKSQLNGFEIQMDGVEDAVLLSADKLLEEQGGNEHFMLNKMLTESNKFTFEVKQEGNKHILFATINEMSPKLKRNITTKYEFVIENDSLKQITSTSYDGNTKLTTRNTSLEIMNYSHNMLSIYADEMQSDPVIIEAPIGIRI